MSMMIQKNKHSLGSDAPLSLSVQSVMEQEAATVARKNSSKNMSSRKVANDEERSVVIRNNNANVALSTFGDQISARLDDEILKMKPTNRSSDLVPLNHRYALMQKELKGLVEASKTYHRKMVEMDQARMEMVTRLGKLSAKTPLEEPINGSGRNTLSNAMRGASQKATLYSKSYQEKILNYVLAWEQTLSKRIDFELGQVKKLQENLTHYQNKTGRLRKTSNQHAKPVPAKLTEKLQRNEFKLDAAWRDHESRSSKLCNLLEAATRHGWKDLYPLVEACIQWEVERASVEYESLVTRLPSVSEKLSRHYHQERHAAAKTSLVPVAEAKTTEGVSSPSTKTGLLRRVSSRNVSALSGQSPKRVSELVEYPNPFALENENEKDDDEKEEEE